jgi:hypothetical protein
VLTYMIASFYHLGKYFKLREGKARGCQNLLPIYHTLDFLEFVDYSDEH